MGHADPVKFDDNLLQRHHHLGPLLPLQFIHRSVAMGDM